MDAFLIGWRGLHLSYRNVLPILPVAKEIFAFGESTSLPGTPKLAHVTALK